MSTEKSKQRWKARVAEFARRGDATAALIGWVVGLLVGYGIALLTLARSAVPVLVAGVILAGCASAPPVPASPFAGPVPVKTPEEARKLPRGTYILMPDGNIGRVP